MDGRTDGWTDWRAGGRAVGCMDGRTDLTVTEIDFKFCLIKIVKYLFIVYFHRKPQSITEASSHQHLITCL